ncbi:NADH-quinone oxidoreductase subunit B family protein [Sulfuracidifex metallicus]|uniref:NADH-quinone oxidoreductase subunit B family protein n=1 Tax=Sulfuracidifex metallicus TaxID=47303 RepID=UPI002272498E|nr:NADH:ubiquinone oxidoreductase [Sulfuracidifex metallicus]MCY0850102.1 NADH:ubiquinone oxidoreductase [Sulfuracidifex metallicus]
MNWFLRGLRRGVKTESKPTNTPLWASSLKVEGNFQGCPTNAIEDGWNSGKCIFCRRCYPSLKPTGDHRMASARGNPTFRRSFYLYPLDVGTCGGCNSELKLISSPQYDMTRFGIFFTNSPRNADGIVIMGVLTEGMREVLKETLDAVPSPKVLILLGACAISGGIIGEGVKVEADVIVPGCPPSPNTILDALIKAKGGKGW